MGVQLLTKPLRSKSSSRKQPHDRDAEGCRARRRALEIGTPERRLALSFRVHCRPDVAGSEPTARNGGGTRVAMRVATQHYGSTQWTNSRGYAAKFRDWMISATAD